MWAMYELWFRAAYEPDLIHRRFTSALRPGVRLAGNPKGVAVGETVRVRILHWPGDESRGQQPQFGAFECRAKITTMAVKKISELTVSDLANCTPDVHNPKLVKYHLGLIYNRIFQDDEEVTLLSWEYQEE